jgi:hypothetical protein
MAGGWYTGRLRGMLDDRKLSGPQPDDVSVDQLFSMDKTMLQNIADQLELQHVLRRKLGCSASWFDAECRAKRRECRLLERRYHQTCSVPDYHACVDSIGCRIRLHQSKEEEYWLGGLETCSRSSTRICKLESPLLGRDRDVTSAMGYTANGFTVFLAHKIGSFRTDTGGLPLPPVIDSATSSIASFRPCLQEEVYKIVMSAPIKSC